jgi:hypothetical protein
VSDLLLHTLPPLCSASPWPEPFETMNQNISCLLDIVSGIWSQQEKSKWIQCLAPTRN